MQEGDPFYRVFFPPPVPLSGEMDPSVDPSTKSRQAAGKVDPSGMMLYHRRDAAKIYAPQCGSHLSDKRSSTTTS